MKNSHLKELMETFSLDNKYINILNMFDYNELALSRIKEVSKTFTTDARLTLGNRRIESTQLGKQMLSEEFLSHEDYEMNMSLIKELSRETRTTTEYDFDGRDDCLEDATYHIYNLPKAQKIIYAASKGNVATESFDTIETLIASFIKEHKQSPYFKEDLLTMALCDNLVTLNGVYLVATNEHSIQSPYHLEDIDFIVNSDNLVTSRFLVNLACDKKSLESDSHKQHMQAAIEVLENIDFEEMARIENYCCHELDKSPTKEIDVNSFVKVLKRANEAYKKDWA